MHQTINGNEALLQMEQAGDYPDIIVASAKAYISALNKLIFKSTKSTKGHNNELKIEWIIKYWIRFNLYLSCLFIKI